MSRVATLYRDIPSNMLPVDLVCIICSDMDVRDVLSLEGSSSAWLAAAGDSSIWSLLLTKHFPEYATPLVDTVSIDTSTSGMVHSTSGDIPGSSTSGSSNGSHACAQPASRARALSMYTSSISSQQQLFMQLWAGRKSFLGAGWHVTSLGNQPAPYKMQASLDAGNGSGQVGYSIPSHASR